MRPLQPGGQPLRPLVLLLLVASLSLLVAVSWQSASFRQQIALSTSKTYRAAAHSTLGLLSARLRKLEAQPIASYRDSLRVNQGTCAGREIQSNIDQINGQSTFWAGLSSQTLREKRQSVIDGIRKEFGLPGLLDSSMDILKSPMYGNGGRGIVYTGGNAVCLSLESEQQQQES